MSPNAFHYLTFCRPVVARLCLPIFLLLSSAPFVIAQTLPVANPLVWLRADAGVGLSGTNVTGWTNQSASGSVFIPPTVNQRPGWVTNLVNGLPGLRFYSGRRLNGNLGQTLSNATIFTLCRFGDGGGDDYVYALGNATGAGRQFSFARRSGVGAAHNDGAVVYTNTTADFLGLFKVFTQVYGEGGPTQHLLYEDIFELLRSQSTQPYLVQATNTILGNHSGSQYFTGELVEWLLYDRVLVPSERQQVETYLRQRAALTTIRLVTNEVQLGIVSDFFVPADYDGDGKTDVAIWRKGAPGVAAFHIRRSSDLTIQTNILGQTGDNPTIVGDYDGDGMADPAVFRGGTNSGDASTWIYRSSANGSIVTVTWGQYGDFVAPGDYDGDGRYDFVVQRGSFSGTYLMRFSSGATETNVFGSGSAPIVPGDYDGDGRTDIASANYVGGAISWSILTRAGVSSSRQFGASATDFTVQGDYNGDGTTDLAVWRPGTNGTFQIHYMDTNAFSAGNDLIFKFGQSGDYPPANFNTH